MRNLSKSKLMAYRQCPKRLWLEIHSKEPITYSATAEASFKVGHSVGDIARRLYDPKNKGALIEPQIEGYQQAIDRTATLLQSAQPIFEAGFSAGGALAFADVMLPFKKGGKRVWRMIEVKSSASVKDYHLDDVAVQAFVARNAGAALESISLAHIDSEWVYPGNDNYDGLLVETDLSAEAFSRDSEVKTWIKEAQVVVKKTKEPAIGTGQHCSKPYPCRFIDYCSAQEIQAEYPAAWLPNVTAKKLTNFIENEGIVDMSDIPDTLLSEQQLRVKTHTLSDTAFFDAKGAAKDLAAHKLPAYFMDFETVKFAVPIWKGTRPYRQIPFQFSVQKLSRTRKLTEQSFLDLSGKNPAKGFAESLIAACGDKGAIFVYNAGFETARIKELAAMFPRLSTSLLAINERVVDLLPIARARYYHPSQQGSWSIKAVLPAISDMSYEALEGVQGGLMAMDAYRNAISPEISQSEKLKIEQELIAYCGLDTLAMVKLWRFFTGQTD